MSNPLSRLKMKKTNPQKLKKIQIRIQTGVTTTDDDGKTIPVKSKIVDATEEDFDIVAFKNKLAESRQNKFLRKATRKIEFDDDKLQPKSRQLQEQLLIKQQKTEKENSNYYYKYPQLKYKLEITQFQKT